MIKELGPVLTALILARRLGSGIVVLLVASTPVRAQTVLSFEDLARRVNVGAREPYFGEQAVRHAVAAVLVTNPTLIPSTSDTCAGSEAETNRSWAALIKSARVGRRLTVTLRDSTTADGTLQAVDVRSISIEQPGRLRVIDAADVVRVRDAGIRTRHVAYGILFGAVAGAVAGVVIDQRSSHPSSRKEAATVGAVFIGLPAGAIVGAVLPLGPPLYEAPDVIGRALAGRVGPGTLCPISK